MRTLLRVLLWSCLVMVTWSLYVLNISPPAEAEAREDLASSLQPATSGTSAGEAGRGAAAVLYSLASVDTADTRHM